MQKLEGLHYVNKLYLKMGYYTIQIFTASQDMTAIFTEFGKFRYNCLSMGMCASGDIFQAKVDDMLCDIKGFKKYIVYLLALNKERLSKRL